MHLPSLILQYIESVPAITYAAIFIGMIVEGDLVLLTAIYSAHTGYLDFAWVLPISFAGMFFGDILWYYTGNRLEWFLMRRRITQGAAPFLDSHLSKRPALTLTLSKFVYFLHRLVYIRAHKVGLALHTFLIADLIAGSVWFFTISALGIIFAASFILLRHYVHFAEIGLLVGILVLIGGERIVSFVFKRRVSRSHEEN